MPKKADYNSGAEKVLRSNAKNVTAEQAAATDLVKQGLAVGEEVFAEGDASPEDESSYGK